jgi:hypothetical protein
LTTRARLGPCTGVQNTSVNRFDLRSRAMTGLPEGLRNTNENRMRARLARQREQQQMMRDSTVAFGAFNPNFSRDAATAGANSRRLAGDAGNADPNIELKKQTDLLGEIKVDLANSNQTLSPARTHEGKRVGRHWHQRRSCLPAKTRTSSAFRAKTRSDMRPRPSFACTATRWRRPASWYLYQWRTTCLCRSHPSRSWITFRLPT